MTCPYCRTEIVVDDAVVTCSRCSLPYHAECWQENGGCATYGCAGRPTAFPTVGRAASQPVEVHLEPDRTTAPATLPVGAPARPGEPWRRPLLVVMCEACAVAGAVAGAVIGFLYSARHGFIGAVMGLIVGIVLGTVVGALAVPVALVGGALYLAFLTLEGWGVAGILLPLALCAGVFLLLLGLRVQSWPPIFR